jgi:hypothetical protein
MKRTRPVFESFGAFVDTLNLAIFEDVAPEGGNVDDLNQTIATVLPEGEARKSLQDIVNLLNGYMTPKSAEKIVKRGKGIEEKASLSDKGVKIKGLLYGNANQGTYKYLKDGYVKAKNYPSYSKSEGDITATGSTVGDTVKSIPLRDLLRTIFEYNITIVNDALYNIDGDAKKDKENAKVIEPYSLGGPESVYKEGKFTEEVNKPLVISKESFGKTVLEVVTLDTFPLKNYGDYYYTLCLPMYYVNTGGIVPGGGQPAGVDSYIDVVPPTSSSKPEETYTFSSADYGDEVGKGFFGNNDTTISAEGMAEIRSLISKFNKISKIEISGSASNLSTTREGGNQKLAEDRRAAGITAIEAIQEEKGAEQIVGAEVVEGTATVQPGGEAANPKMRNVTFKVTGELKSSEPTPTATEDKPATITKISEKKFDSVAISSQILVFKVGFFE